MDPKVQEFELEEETGTRAVVHFESCRCIVQRIRCIDIRDRSQVLSMGYEACLCWDTERVSELGGTGTSTADWEEVFDNCTSLKEEEQPEVISRVSEGFVSRETTEVFTIPWSTRKKVRVLGRAYDTIVMWKATSDFPQLDAVFASVVRLASKFPCYSKNVAIISQVHLGEGGSSDVTDRQRRVESWVLLSLGNVLDIGWKRLKLVGVLICSNLEYDEKLLQNGKSQLITDFSSKTE